MSFLNSTLIAAAAGRTVRAALLVKFEFTSTTKRVWAGFGNLVADGQTWTGLGELGSVEGLEFRADQAAVPLVFKLSGVDSSFTSAAADAEDEVKGNPVTVYLQFFDEDWQTLDNPVAIAAGIMDTMVFDATGPTQRTITLTAEGLFGARGAAPFARYTDRDQQGRFSGDRGCEYVPQLVNMLYQWPEFD